jgi:tRNA modification GTPase
MGIEVSERYVAQAHVVLACAETDAALASTCAAITTRTRGAVIAVRTKSDLHLAGQHDAGEGSAGKAVGAAAVAVRALTVSAVAVSAVTGHGLAALRGAIRTAVGQQIATPDDDLPVITRARHEAALRHARDELLAFRGAWAAASLPAPVAATHLRAAVTALESLIGAVDTDDVLDRVFRTFCIGK